MARTRNTILSGKDSLPLGRGSSVRRGKRVWPWLTLLLAVLALAWFDGGEEPIHPIAQEIPVPEAN